jgi:hypothetical protein
MAKDIELETNGISLLIVVTIWPIPGSQGYRVWGVSQTFSQRTLSEIPKQETKTGTLEENPEPRTPEPIYKLCLNAFIATSLCLL